MSQVCSTALGALRNTEVLTDGERKGASDEEKEMEVLAPSLQTDWKPKALPHMATARMRKPGCPARPAL